jgi:hypothetical protein
MAVVPGQFKEIEYMQRRIGAVPNPTAGVDSKLSVQMEVAEMFKNGWTLFATHYGGDNGSGVVVMHIFVR